MAGIDNLIEQFASTGVEEQPKQISFVGKGLHLNTEEDAKDIVDTINNCPGMVSLRLEGNTVGPPAAKVIGEALEKQPDFRLAYWKDMFTGRDKTEIPEALDHLSKGMMIAGARLVVLDLSDNAFGPRGLVGIQSLLESPCCHTLQELHLNNIGLGISGGKMLSEAVLNCIENSKKAGTPMSLKIFVCGRNRLENEGAVAISKFLKALGTLESVAMPQNGIYPPGIRALSDAFASNKNLKVINLEDNSLTEEGAKCIAECLPNANYLEMLNLGDCLVRTKGATDIAAALKDHCPNLLDVNLGFNEIGIKGGMDIVDAMKSKDKLQVLNLNGNQFGKYGCTSIQDKLRNLGKLEILAPMSDDEGDDDDDGDNVDEDDDDEYEDIDEDDYDDEEEDSDTQVDVIEESESPIKTTHKSPMSNINFSDFMSNPSAQSLISLSQSNEDYTSVLPSKPSYSDYLELFFKISLVVTPGNEAAKTAACKFTDDILSKAFEIGIEDIVSFNNEFLVSIGLIKSEDKKRTKKGFDISGTLIVLSHAVQQPYFEAKTRELLMFSLSKPLLYVTASPTSTHLLMQSMFKV